MSLDLLLSPELWLAMLHGLEVTISLTAISMAVGLLLGIGVAACHVYGSTLLHRLAVLYIFVFRGVPMLVLLYFLYYGMAQVAFLRHSFLWDLFLKSAFWTTVVAFTINNGAYLAESIRGGMLAVARGQIEAGYAIGLTGLQVFRRIVLPIALRSRILTIGNEVIFTIKASAIASVVTVRDVLGEAQHIGIIYSDNFSPLIGAAVIFLVVVQAVELAVRQVDRHLNRERQRPTTRRRGIHLFRTREHHVVP